MNKVFICSPYRGDTKNNIEKAIGYCRMADIHGWLPICPHVYFTRVYPDDSWHAHYTWESWGMKPRCFLI